MEIHEICHFGHYWVKYGKFMKYDIFEVLDLDLDRSRSISIDLSRSISVDLGRSWSISDDLGRSQTVSVDTNYLG